MRSSLENDSPKKILLFAERNKELLELVNELEGENFSVEHVSTIGAIIGLLKKEKPDVIILDSSKNEMGCLEFCYALRSDSETKKGAVIIISDRYDEKAEVEAFRCGADDFVIKPLRLHAFIERIKIRTNKPDDVIRVQQKGNRAHAGARIRIDRESYSVFVNNDSLSLSRKEFELLYLMASQPGRIFSRDELSEKIWKRKMGDHERTIDVHILKVRKKLGNDLIHTQKGVGYKFNA